MISSHRRYGRPRGRGRRRELAAGAVWIATLLFALGCASRAPSAPSLTTPPGATPTSATPLLDQARVVYLLGRPSAGVLAPERLQEDVGAQHFDRWAELAPELARGAVDVLVLDDGSIGHVDLDAVARACQDHGIVLAGVNISLQALAYPVLRRYRSPVVRRAVDEEVYGPDEPLGGEERLSVFWAPSENAGATSSFSTGWGRDGTPGVAHDDLYDLAQRLETHLDNRELQGWPMAWEREAEGGS